MLNQKSIRIFMAIATLSCSLSLVACGSGKEDNKTDGESAPQTSGDKKSGDKSDGKSGDQSGDKSGGKSGGKDSPKTASISCDYAAIAGICTVHEVPADQKDKVLAQMNGAGAGCSDTKACPQTGKLATCQTVADEFKNLQIYYTNTISTIADITDNCKKVGGSLTIH